LCNLHLCDIITVWIHIKRHYAFLQKRFY